MYCLFNKDITSGEQSTNIKNLGYVLFVFFQILAFVFLLWKIFTGENEIRQKGVLFSEFIQHVMGKSPFGKWTSSIFYTVNGLILFYFIAFIIYMKLQPPMINAELSIFLFFVVFAFGLLNYILYSNTRIPIYLVLLIGIILNAVSSILTGISLTNTTNKITSLPKKQNQSLTIYTAITITDVLLLLFLASMLFTKRFTLTFLPSNTTEYTRNNALVTFFSFSLIVLSGYNIYNANKFMLSTQ